MIDRLKKNIMNIVSLLLSAYFFFVFHYLAGMPPTASLTPTTTTYLFLAIFFLLVPSAKKIKLGKIFEYEAKIDEIRSEVKEFKDETRQFLSLQNNLINTVSNTINQSINISLPGLKEANEANQELQETISPSIAQENIEDRISELLSEEDNDQIFALVKLRIRIEQELRKIMGKRLEADPIRKKHKFLSVRSLFRSFIVEYPKYQGMYSSFDYILIVCNAGAHGQKVPERQAHEALSMGIKMLEQLKEISKTS